MLARVLANTPMASTPSGTYRLIEAGRAAVQRGERERGRELLLQAVERDEHSAEAWWWLSQTLDDPADLQLALENVLTLEPGHPQARARLDQLRAAPAKPPAADWQSLLPHVPQEPDDGIDDPLQCVYCGRPTQAEDRKCPHCGQGLTVRVQASGDSAFLRLGLLLLGVDIAAGLIELGAPLLALSALQGGARAGLEIFAQVPGVPFVLGDFLGLTAASATLLAYGLGLRVLILVSGLIGLTQRWAWAYYATLAALAADVLLNIFLLFGGYVGAGPGVLNLGLALALLYLIGASYQEFSVSWQRLLTQPDSRARSAAAFFKLGHDYSRAGMWALAVAQWRRAVGLAPKEAPYYKQLGLGYARLKRYERSLRALEEAARRAPRDRDLPEIIALVRSQLASSESAQTPSASSSHSEGAK